MIDISYSLIAQTNTAKGKLLKALLELEDIIYSLNQNQTRGYIETITLCGDDEIWKTTRSKAIPVEIMPDSIVIADMRLLRELLSLEIIHPRGLFIAISAELAEKAPKQMKTIMKEGNILFDERTDKILTKDEITNQYIYNGELTQTCIDAYLFEKSNVVDTLDNALSLMGVHSPNVNSWQNKIDYSIAKYLFPNERFNGRFVEELFEEAKRINEIPNTVVAGLSIESNLMSQEVQELVNILSDMAELVKWSSQYTNVEKIQTTDNYSEKIAKAKKNGQQCLADCIETYESGVPAEDIVA